MVPARLLIVDDHPVVRIGFRFLLEGMDDATVVAEAGSRKEALEMLAQKEADLAVVDVHMENTSGIELARQIKQRFPNVRVLLTSAYEDREYVEAGLEAGADGYVLKHNLDGDILKATEALLKGERYLCDGAKVLLEEDQNQNGANRH